MAKGKTMKFTKALERLCAIFVLLFPTRFMKLSTSKQVLLPQFLLNLDNVYIFQGHLGLLAAPFDYLYREARNFKNGTNNILRRDTR